MKIFLSYSSADREVAEEIQLALTGAAHKVFFDKDSLPPGGDYHSRIDQAVQEAEIFVFLISPNSVAFGSYALTELKFARSKWPHPRERVLPVKLRGTSWTAIPAYLKSVTVLEPEGNVAAEVVDAVASLTRTSVTNKLHQGEEKGHKTTSRHRTQIWMAIFGLISVLGMIGAIANWKTLFLKTPNTGSVMPSMSSPLPSATISKNGIKGSDTARSDPPNFSIECAEITFWDNSKVPPESYIIQECPSTK